MAQGAAQKEWQWVPLWASGRDKVAIQLQGHEAAIQEHQVTGWGAGAPTARSRGELRAWAWTCIGLLGQWAERGWMWVWRSHLRLIRPIKAYLCTQGPGNAGHLFSSTHQRVEVPVKSDLSFPCKTVILKWHPLHWGCLVLVIVYVRNRND